MPPDGGIVNLALFLGITPNSRLSRTMVPDVGARCWGRMLGPDVGARC